MAAVDRFDVIDGLLKEIIDGVESVATEMKALCADARKDFEEIKNEFAQMGQIIRDMEPERAQRNQLRSTETTPEKDLGEYKQSQKDDEKEAGLMEMKTKAKMASGARKGKENAQLYFQKKKYDSVQEMFSRQKDIKRFKMEKDQIEMGVKERKQERKRGREDSEKGEEKGGCMKGGGF